MKPFLLLILLTSCSDSVKVDTRHKARDCAILGPLYPNCQSNIFIEPGSAKSDSFNDIAAEGKTYSPLIAGIEVESQAADGYVNALESNDQLPVFNNPRIPGVTTRYSAWVSAGEGLKCNGNISYALELAPATAMLPAVDGLYGVCLELTDLRGYKAYGLGTLVLRDTLPPEIVPISDITANSDVIIDASITEAHPSKFEWSQVAGPGSVLFQKKLGEDVTVSATVNGDYVLKLNVLDKAGNQAEALV
ncbi:MAG: hypothetical protein M3Q07_05965, partial [Pseudobdellovibrionaceae bacterium]|nr:hypothetical protein [Pseudobdellovibrionaceae bacterium]